MFVGCFAQVNLTAQQDSINSSPSDAAETVFTFVISDLPSSRLPITCGAVQENLDFDAATCGCARPDLANPVSAVAMPIRPSAGRRPRDVLSALAATGRQGPMHVC
jgi:hypothetical protein